jgi:type IX secretion system PorP/SprF family membrane protein
MYNNPANAGYYKGLKARTHYHDQWRGVSNRIKTANISVEFSGRELPGGGGIGLIINSFPEFDGIMKSSVGIVASSRIRLSETWIAQFGVSGFFIQNNMDIDRDKFIWSKQLDNRHGLLYPDITVMDVKNYTHRYFDLNVGGLLGYESEFRAARIGFSVHHVTHPNVAFLDDNTVRLPLRYSLEGDFAFLSAKNIYGVVYHPSFLFEIQGNIPSYNIGINFAKSIFYAGVFYHQSSMASSFKTITPDMGVVIPLNDKTQRLKIGYSYEIPLQVAGDIGGVHEITLRYEYDALQLIRSWKLFPIGNPDLKKRLRFL